jgi:Skp family chaperone for outer membrane proteins
MPSTLKERILYVLVAVLMAIVVVLAASRKAQSSEDIHESVDLEWCIMSLESAEMMRDHYKGDLEEERKLYKETLKKREKLWEEIYERVKRQKAGEVCWAKNEALQQQIEDEKKFYRWSLKFGGYIKDKTDREVNKHEKKVQEFVDGLDSEELEKLEED